MKRNSLLLFSLIGLAYLLFAAACSQKHRSVKSDSEPINHDSWNSLLQKHVDKEGWVDYDGFAGDQAELNAYLELLRQNHPTKEKWTSDERLAYWINAYNAFTVQLILNHAPINSIKDIAGSIPFVNSPWDIRFISIEGNNYDLNNIEHNILRKEFMEPRIHFAINCASASCPLLLNEAFVAHKIEAQLETAAIAFVNDSNRNKISPDVIEISKIFSWFKGDFTKDSSLIDFLNKYSETKINEKAKIEHLDYDWSLNQQKGR